MNQLRWIIPCIALSFLAGCIQVSTVVRVNPDGSGTVVETMLISKKMIARMNEMLQGFGGETSGGKPEPLKLFEPEKLKAQAAKMGNGVSYLAGEQTETADFSGYTATYGFKDINELKLNQQKDESAGETLGQKAPSLPVIFRFRKGSPATLVIEQARDKTPAKGAETQETDPAASRDAKGVVADAEAKQLAEMFMGMKMAMTVEVNGAIVETNASHRDGNQITLVDLDLARFGSALPQLEKLKLLSSSSPAEATELLKNFPGVKIDLNERLEVVFRK